MDLIYLIFQRVHTLEIRSREIRTPEVSAGSWRMYFSTRQYAHLWESAGGIGDSTYLWDSVLRPSTIWLYSIGQPEISRDIWLSARASIEGVGYGNAFVIRCLVDGDGYLQLSMSRFIRSIVAVAEAWALVSETLIHKWRKDREPPGLSGPSS
jgi:hypothetical protein